LPCSSANASPVKFVQERPPEDSLATSIGFIPTIIILSPTANGFISRTSSVISTI
ncbi:hypothetical protein FRC08_018110, partial [Ceratobasidium sp. 394]